MVRVNCTGPVARIVLDDAASSNALGEAMVEALTAAFAEVDRQANVRVVLLTSDGDVFSSGAPRDLLVRLAA